MKNIYKIVILTILTLSLAHSWEINTHRAIDRCAIVKDKSCGRGEVAKNLHWFAENVGIKNESYYEEKLPDYTLPNGTKNISYFEYVTKGEPYIGISTWNQTFSHYKYTDLIEAGTILEDAPSTIVTGGSVDLKFTDGGGINGATSYTIYRSNKNAATAAVSKFDLVTRDSAIYKTYFPSLKLIHPDSRMAPNADK